MYLLPNEQELLNSNGNKVILTDKRIRLVNSVLGKSNQITLFLEDISSIENLYQNNVLYVILAIGSAIAGGIGIGNEHLTNLMIGGIILAAVFFILWLGSRKNTITITPDGGKPLSFDVEGMGDEEIEDFLFKVQKAKHERINTLYKLV